MMNNFCEKCGERIEGDVSFCTKCGAKINRRESVGEQTREVEEKILEPSKAGTKKIVIGVGVGVAVAVVIVAVVLYLVFGVEKSEDVNPEQTMEDKVVEDTVVEDIVEEDIQEDTVEEDIAEEEAEVEEEVITAVDYAEISELFCGFSGTQTHVLGNTGIDWVGFESQEEEYFMAGALQAYDQNPETIFVYIHGDFYYYEDIQSRVGNVITLYNEEVNKTVEMEYVNEYEFVWSENGEEQSNTQSDTQSDTQTYIKYDTTNSYEELVLSDSELDADITLIREWYYSTQADIESSDGITVQGDGSIDIYRQENSSLPVKVVVSSGVNGIDYTREYYYSDENFTCLYFIFAYNSEGEEHRIYIRPDDYYVIRYIYNDTIYNLGDEIPAELEWLKDYYYQEGWEYVPN